VRCFPKDTTLSILVPKSANYGYDIISSVGLGSFIEGRKLSDIQKELQSQIAHFKIPYSSLYDQQRKFLFYFGLLHQCSMPLIKEYLACSGDIGWLVDGTLEPGTDVFFGVQECKKNIMLDCRKIATENEKDITEFLLDVGKSFGHPQQIIHDLSRAIGNACHTAFKDVVQLVCHSHFTKNVGKALYDAPYEMLYKQIKKLKLKVHLNDQRKNQSRWLRNRVDDRDNLILEQVLKGIEIPAVDNKIHARELFLSLNQWILDYADDGKRQGYPFDPYLLYFHRRIDTVHNAVNRILKSCDATSDIPQCLIYLSNKLGDYLSDDQITDASNLFEKAFSIFNDIRDCLRMSDAKNNPSPIYESYQLSSSEHKEIATNILDLKSELKEQQKMIVIEIEKEKESEHKKEKENKKRKEKKLYEIALEHIDKYEPYLINELSMVNSNGKIIRTTNQLEQDWGSAKRVKRHVTGRKKLTREFNSLPKEFMLAQNLKNPDYVDLVLGSIEKLPERLAEIGSQASSFSSWVKKQNTHNIGRISKTIIRKDNFIKELVEISPGLLEVN